MPLATWSFAGRWVMSSPSKVMAPLLAAAVGIVLVSLTDTIALSTSFAARRGEEVDPNQEMIGIGSANVAAGLFQGFAVSASSSRTAVAEQSGTKSQVTGLVGAVMVVVLLVFLPSLLSDLPQTALAAVVIGAAFSLMDVPILRKYLRVRRSALALSLVATIGVVLFGVLQGILLAVVLSILLFFRRSWWPHGEILGHEIPDLDGWHSVERYPDARQEPGVLVFRWEAPLFFANAGIFRQQVRRLVHRHRPRWFVLQCEAITDIDVTAADMLERLDVELGIRIKTLSHGNRQKLGLVQAFMHRPELLILDEPTQGLDPLIQQVFYELVEETRADGRSVFLSSHVMPEVERVCDRVGIIREGRLVAVEDIGDLRAKEIRTLDIHFAAPLRPDAFDGVPGVHEAEVFGDVARVTVGGTMDAVIKRAAAFEIVDLRSHELGLEEIFLAFYGGDGGGE